ncbi:hypothetical protein ACT3TS_12220 [Specibacter sp. AOP5-B1-6]|uniref:hypothetical protein n=1 Tax=Specibacter sp. AOP5-B1-6 TaxID=3457653 RepID=UPI00402B2D92
METLRTKLTLKLKGITDAPVSTVTDTIIITPLEPSCKSHRATETHKFTAATGAAKPPTS